mgnify:CR=1 FL=1
MAPFFGASILIWANIIGLILIYLSVGYFVGGRLADRHPTMRFLCWLMLAAAGCVAVLPFVAEPFLSAAVDAFAGASVGGHREAELLPVQRVPGEVDLGRAGCGQPEVHAACAHVLGDLVTGMRVQHGAMRAMSVGRRDSLGLTTCQAPTTSGPS